MTARRSFVAVVGAMLVAGCATPGDRETAPASLRDPRSLDLAGALSGGATGDWPDDRWWRGFGAPALDSLIESALAESPAVRTAEARFAQARALVAAARADEPLSAVGALDLTRQRFSEHGLSPGAVAGTTRDTARVAIDLAWDFDLMKRRESRVALALAEADAVAADRANARLALASAIVRAWFRLERAAAGIALLEREIAVRERLIALAARRVEAGLDGALALREAEALPPVLRSEIARLEGGAAVTRNQISALAGAGPGGGRDLAVSAGRGFPALRPLPANLPLDLVGRRADLAALRLRAEAAARRIDLARAAFVPNVNLIAFAGLSSVGLGNLFDLGSRILGAGPALRLPLFTEPRLRAELRGAEAAELLAIESYNERLVEAIREVADAVDSRRSVEAEARARAGALRARETALVIGTKRLDAGLGDAAAVLRSELSLIDEERAGIEYRYRALEADLALVAALGGGYREVATTGETR